ncbi:MAG TPA: hypothetical protein VFU36_15755 [Jatrophihabitans sp.]|nr:hypothetical protein [Jatrophihabitans sp.]
MPGSPSIVTRFCRAGQWTQVEWYIGTIWLTKRYAVGSVHVDWRWYSAGLVPYWAGNFSGSACISIPPSVYTSLEFKPAADVNVIISATC